MLQYIVVNSPSSRCRYVGINGYKAASGGRREMLQRLADSKTEVWLYFGVETIAVFSLVLVTNILRFYWAVSVGSVAANQTRLVGLQPSVLNVHKPVRSDARKLPSYLRRCLTISKPHN